MRVTIGSVILFFYFVLAIAFFFVMGDAMLNEETGIQFFADSATYEQAAIELKELTPLELIMYNPNYFGQITILNLMNGSRWGVLILNLFVFVLSVSIVSRAISLDRRLLIMLLIVNPMTFSSLLSINKEIYSLLTIALLIYGVGRNSSRALFACLVVSFFVRWQLSLFAIVFWVLISPLNIFRHRRLLTVLILIVVMSILYYVIRPLAFSNVSEVALAGAEQWEGSGLWGRLLDVQNSGGYFLVFPIKVLHAMFGILAYMENIIDPPEFYNYVVVMLHSLTMLFMLIYAFVKKKLSLRRDIFYIVMIYLLIFGLTPIYAPRYFYPVFVLLCVLVAERSIGRDDFCRLDRGLN